MRKLLVTALLLVGTLAALAPPTAAQVASGGQTGYATPTPSGPQAGEVALGSFVAPTRTRSPLVGHGAAGSYRADRSCSTQCITSGVAYGRGPDARLVVTTDTPATIRIVVSRSGYYRMISSEAGATSLSADFGDLEADTPYDAFVSAVDGNGHLADRSGSFRTLQRNVHVVFNEADVWETPYGNDPFYAQNWFEGEGGDGYATGALGALEPGEIHLGAQALHEDDTDRYLSVGLELKQHDTDVDLCEATPDPDQPEVGYGNCDYAVTAWLADGELDLDARPASATNVNDYWIGGTMVLPNVDDAALPGSFGLPLQFSVPVGVRVTFT